MFLDDTSSTIPHFNVLAMTSGVHGGVVNDGVSTGVAAGAAVVRLDEEDGRGVVDDGVTSGAVWTKRAGVV